MAAFLALRHATTGLIPKLTCATQSTLGCGDGDGGRDDRRRTLDSYIDLCATSNSAWTAEHVEWLRAGVAYVGFAFAFTVTTDAPHVP